MSLCYFLIKICSTEREMKFNIIIRPKAPSYFVVLIPCTSKNFTYNFPKSHVFIFGSMTSVWNSIGKTFQFAYFFIAALSVLCILIETVLFYLQRSLCSSGCLDNFFVSTVIFFYLSHYDLSKLPS